WFGGIRGLLITRTKKLTVVFSSRILGHMDEFRKTGKASDEKNLKTEQLDEPAYPASIEKMSETWRSIQRQNPDAGKGSFVERNYLALGIGVGLLIMAFLIVIGGVVFLIWNAH